MSKTRLIFAVRVLLGGLFVASGALKLRDLQVLGFAIQSFDLPLPAWGVTTATFFLPWLELVTGAAVLSGLGYRSGALILGALCLIFMSLIGSLMVRGLSVDCPCFGEWELLCSGPLGTCHVIRNMVCAILAFWLVAGSRDDRPVAQTPTAHGPLAEACP